MHLSLSAATLGLAALLPAHVSAFWRMPCGHRVTTERIDPLIFPGVVSPHVHQVAGGNGFGYTETYEQARNASCSSCPITQDLSNYWTPVLYYKARDGTFTKVPQAGDSDTAGTNGGMTVYYLQRPGYDGEPLLAFPEGFRMIAGNPFVRNFTGDYAAQAVSFVCLNYSPHDNSHDYTNGLPTMACPDGVRAQVFFPSCWDGVNLDTPDHSSHMAYPVDNIPNSEYNGGVCPDSHPVHLVSIFYEVIFSTAGFEFWDGGFENKQPFVFAQGDPTGYGFHGDFINGWDVPELQKAVDECTDLSGVMTDCDVFTYFEDEDCKQCQIPTTVHEDIDGPLQQLPGCNPVADGPGLAVPAPCAVTPIGAPEINFTDVTQSLKWSYIGCANDSVVNGERTLNGYNNIYGGMDPITVSSCIAQCKSQGSTYAGVEYGAQCFCGNTVSPDRMPTDSSWSQCDMPCAGDGSQICGGPNALGLYKACDASGPCANWGYTPYGDLLGNNIQPMVSTYSGAASAIARESAFTASAVSAGHTSVGSADSAFLTATGSAAGSSMLAGYGTSTVASAATSVPKSSAMASSAASTAAASKSSKSSPSSASAAASATGADKLHVASSILTAAGSSASSAASSAVSAVSSAASAVSSAAAPSAVSSDDNSSTPAKTVKSPHSTTRRHRTKTSAGSSQVTTEEVVTATTVGNVVYVTEVVTTTIDAPSKRGRKQHAHEHKHLAQHKKNAHH